MNLKNFQNHISSTILNRGKEYCYNGAVNVLEEEEDGVWCAEVEGSEVYSVEVELSAGGEIDSYTCDCPHEADVCKHIVAVFYELKDKVKIIKLKPEKKGKKQALSFNELLETISFAELKQFVSQHAQNDKNLKNQFELYFAHKDEHFDIEKKYSDLLKKAIRSSMSQGYVGYYSAGELSMKADSFLNKAQEAFGNHNFKEASIIARVVLKQLVEEVIPSADDSNGNIGDTIFNAVQLLASVAESGSCNRELKEDLYDFFAKALVDDTYFDYGDFGESCFEIFRNLAVQLNRPEMFLALSNLAVRDPGEETSEDYKTEFFILQTLLFFQETGNVQEAEKLIRQNMHIVEIRQNVVDNAINRQSYEEAKELIREGIDLADKRQHPGTVFNWQKTLLDIACLEGDIPMQRQLNLHFAFDRGFNIEYYEGWKKTFTQAEWETEFRLLVGSIIAEVEQQAEKNLNNHWWSKNRTILNQLAPVYVQEKQWNKLYQLVESYPSLDVLLSYMKYLAKDYQVQLTELICPALVLAGDKADSRSGYSQIASHMQNIIKLMPESKNKILETAQILRAKYPRRPAMHDELKKVR